MSRGVQKAPTFGEAGDQPNIDWDWTVKGGDGVKRSFTDTQRPHVVLTEGETGPQIPDLDASNCERRRRRGRRTSQ